MKTFILNSINRLKSFSQNLDVESTLYSKSWEVFNETGDKELFIFRANNELLISRNGIVQKGKWELLNIATLLIDVADKSYLLNAAYIEDKFLALKLDGTNEYMVMIETDMKDRFSLNTIGSIEKYLEDRYKRIEQERIDQEKAEQKRLEAERIKEEQERIEKERAELFKLFEEERKKEQEREERLENLKRTVGKGYKKYTVWFIVSIVLLVISFGLFRYEQTDLWAWFVFVSFLSFVFSLIWYISSRADYKEYQKLKESEQPDGLQNNPDPD